VLTYILIVSIGVMAASRAIPSFGEGTEVESYLERLDCYFLVTKTTDED